MTDAANSDAARPPLQNILVIEMARVLAGPWIGQLLSDLGADVIKIEAPGGDDPRRWGPPFIERKGQKNAAYFHCCNRGKRSVVADIKTSAGLDLVRRLASRADIFIQNHRPGGLEKYGLDYATLSAQNPRLIYCSVSGYGQDGPDAALPGYDLLAQAAGGLMSVTGEADGEALKTGVPIADIFTALYGVIGAQAALLRREADGLGDHIDLSLLDSTVGIMSNQAMNYLATGTPPHRRGNSHPTIVPCQSFFAADGAVMVAVGNDRQFAALCGVLGIPDAAQDPDYADNASRVQNRDALAALLQEKLSARTKADFLAACRSAGVPAAAVANLAEAFANPQVRHRQMQTKADGVPGVRAPLRFARSCLAAPRPSPNLDEHGEEVRELARQFGAVERT